MEPLNETCDRKEPGENANEVNHDGNVDLITKNDMSEVQYLNTDIDSSNQENTRLGYKNSITPKCVDIIVHLPVYYRFAKYVHVKCVDNDRHNSTYPKYTELCNHVNTVAKDYHDGHDQNTIINDSFQAKKCCYCKKKSKKNTAQSFFQKKLQQ